MLEENELLKFLRLAKGGDNDAKEVIVQENCCLVKSIVKRYLGKGVEYDDLYQLGCLGLLKAVQGFDESFGVKFSTYAVPMIAGEIKRFMRDDGSIKVSRAIKMQAKLLNKYVQEYQALHESSPSVSHLAEKFNMEESEVVFTLGSTKMPVSIYEQSEYKDEKSREMIETLPFVDETDDIIEHMQLKSAISSLDERERRIIYLRYFRDLTQSEVARLIGVSQVQVSRIENKIMQEFKKQLL